MPPGAVPPGAVPPGAVPPGAVPPGAALLAAAGTLSSWRGIGETDSSRFWFRVGVLGVSCNSQS